MPKRSMDFDDLPDTGELEIKRKPKVSEEDRLKDEIYAKRVKLVALSQTDYEHFKEYLLANEEFFKRHFHGYDAECMRDTCNRAMNNARWPDMEDYKIFNRIFGPWINPRKSSTIPVIGHRGGRL